VQGPLFLAVAVGDVSTEDLDRGPVEVAGAIGDYGRGRFFFRIGRIF